MYKIFERGVIGGEQNPLIEEGVDDYYEEKKEDSEAIEEGMIFEDSFESLKKIFKIISSTKKFNHNFKEEVECRKFLFSELSRILEKKLRERDFVGIIEFGKDALANVLDADIIKKLDPKKPSDAVLITEAINLSAKVADDSFYALKPIMIVASAKVGAKIGVEYANSSMPAYYLFNKEVGVASFHDPGNSIEQLFELIGDNDKIKDWDYGWSGVYRQDEAFNLIAEKERLFLQRMRHKTLPGENSIAKKKLFDSIDEKYSV